MEDSGIGRPTRPLPSCVTGGHGASVSRISARPSTDTGTHCQQYLPTRLLGGRRPRARLPSGRFPFRGRDKCCHWELWSSLSHPWKNGLERTLEKRAKHKAALAGQKRSCFSQVINRSKKGCSAIYKGHSQERFIGVWPWDGFLRLCTSSFG